mmetsp:Transcript_917/g.1924  ORF Transcript_917/g.1924 Transcript_917/m.1924 type:complete len:291 (-) Transcript_917:78-950(-)
MPSRKFSSCSGVSPGLRLYSMFRNASWPLLGFKAAGYTRAFLFLGNCSMRLGIRLAVVFSYGRIFVTSRLTFFDTLFPPFSSSPRSIFSAPVAPKVSSVSFVPFSTFSSTHSSTSSVAFGYGRADTFTMPYTFASASSLSSVTSAADSSLAYASSRTFRSSGFGGFSTWSSRSTATFWLSKFRICPGDRLYVGYRMVFFANTPPRASGCMKLFTSKMKSRSNCCACNNECVARPCFSETKQPRASIRYTVFSVSRPTIHTSRVEFVTARTQYGRHHDPLRHTHGFFASGS